jgi:hypothetical protein
MKTRIRPVHVDLTTVVDALRDELPSVVPEYGRGRERIIGRVTEILEVSSASAKRIVSLLTARGLLHYNDGGRAIGVPGHWEIRRAESPLAAP